jgi:hypothetical protein
LVVTQSSHGAPSGMNSWQQVEHTLHVFAGLHSLVAETTSNNRQITPCRIGIKRLYISFAEPCPVVVLLIYLAVLVYLSPHSFVLEVKLGAGAVGEGKICPRSADTNLNLPRSAGPPRVLVM